MLRFLRLALGLSIISFALSAPAFGFIQELDPTYKGSVIRKAGRAIDPTGPNAPFHPSKLKNSDSDITPVVRGYTMGFRNDTALTVDVYVRFLSLDDTLRNGKNTWVTRGPYRFSPGENAGLSEVLTKNTIVYYYAEAPDTNIVWSSPDFESTYVEHIGGIARGFRKRQIPSTGKYYRYDIPLTNKH